MITTIALACNLMMVRFELHSNRQVMFRKLTFFQVIAIMLSSFQCLYAHDASFPLPSDKINEYPFNMVGKVSSRDFVGSGTAISQKVVLSAAHVFFDIENLDWHPSPFRWNLRHSPSDRIFDISARSYNHFSDFALATRRFQPDDPAFNSYEQFNRDVITLIFYEDVANGGHAGRGSNRITDNSDKMIVGYPNLNYPDYDQRRDTMHSTSLDGSPTKYELIDYYDRQGSISRLYETYDLSTGPGNSGGPVYGLIRFANGTVDWGVVGITVGGRTGESSVAVGIDQAISDLIKEAESTFDTISSDDHGYTRSTATTVELNRSIAGNLETVGDIDYFRFVIKSDGTINAYTTGDTDTLGTLLNNSGNVITTKDGSGSGENFLITRVLNPGTYYIAVSNFSFEKTGRYSFRVDFTETIKLPDLAVDFISVDRRSVVAGESVRVGFNRSNTGEKNSGIFAHGIYLSGDKIITTRDTRLLNLKNISMNVGASGRISFKVIIPTNTIPGIYYLSYILDSDMQIKETDETNNTGYAEITVSEPISDDDGDLVLGGFGDIAGKDIQHPNGNVFDQILLTGPFIKLKAKPGQITRASFMDENEDIVQVEFSGSGTFTMTLDPTTFLPPALPPRYNQQVEYVTGKPSVVIEEADSSTFFSIFTVGSINAVNQTLFPEGQVYDAQADVTLVEVINSTGTGGMQLSNTVFSGSTGNVGVIARGVPIAVRLTVGDINADGDAVPHLLFGEGSFTVPSDNLGLRITGGDLKQTNSASIVVAESGSTTPGFETLISQNNFKSDGIPQPAQSIDATFVNEDGTVIPITVDNLTIE